MLGNNSAFIKDGKDLFIIDCGSTTFERLKRTNILDGVENIYVAITHLHPDHVGSLGDLIFYSYYVINSPLTVIHPFGVKVKECLASMGVSSSFYSINTLDEEFYKTRFNNLQIKSIRVPHVEAIPSFGYMIKYDGDLIYYSGDSFSIPEDIRKMLNDGYIDYFYQDTCVSDFDGNPHLTLSLLSMLVDLNMRKNVYCMHLDEGFTVNVAEDLGFNVVDNVINKSKALSEKLQNWFNDKTEDWVKEHDKKIGDTLK